MSKKKETGLHVRESLLKNAVASTPDVSGHYCDGLKALRGGDKDKISVGDTTLIGGSLDIDRSTLDLYPDSHRWDYAIEYNDETYFIEIHPASTSEVSTMICKLDWLKSWLKNHASNIDRIKAKSGTFNWVYTNRFDILPTSRQYRQAAMKGLIPKAKWEIK